MASVTKRISEISQPKGGYVKLSDFETIQLKKEENCHPIEEENIHASVIGMTVDYLTRYYLTKNAEKAFEVSLAGSEIAEDLFNVKNAKEVAKTFLKNIVNNEQLNRDVIINAMKLVTFDVYRRNPYYATSENGPNSIAPNNETIDNVIIMIKRSLSFWNTYGPITKDGFTFEGGYTDVIDSGDGDYMTKDTIWDFKVSKSKPTSKHTLQLIVYWRMGLESLHKEFQEIKYVGIFNPRLNTVYKLDLKKILPEVLKEIDSYVIGY